LAKTKSAIKRHKQSLKRRTRNRHIRSSVKTAIKEVRSTLESKGVEDAAEVLSKASSVIARAGSKGVLHRKNVARKVARLSSAIHKAASGGK
jgi:small subunit ribosomal protein S20